MLLHKIKRNMAIYWSRWGTWIGETFEIEECLMFNVNNVCISIVFYFGLVYDHFGYNTVLSRCKVFRVSSIHYFNSSCLVLSWIAFLCYSQHIVMAINNIYAFFVWILQDTILQHKVNDTNCKKSGRKAYGYNIVWSEGAGCCN